MSIVLRALAVFSLLSSMTVSAEAQGSFSPGAPVEPATTDSVGATDTYQADAAPAPEPAVTAPVAAPTVVAPSEAEKPARTERVQTIAAGFGWDSIYFHTEDGSNFRIHGPALQLDYFIGRRWGYAFHMGVGFPRFGAVSGGPSDFRDNLSGYDSKRSKIDVLFMAARRVELSPKLAFVGGFGLNVSTVRLVGEVYAAVELIAGGVGGLVRLEYQLTKALFVAGQLTASLDFIDFIRHDNRAVIALPTSGSVNLGLRF